MASSSPSLGSLRTSKRRVTSRWLTPAIEHTALLSLSSRRGLLLDSGLAHGPSDRWVALNQSATSRWQTPAVQQRGGAESHPAVGCSMLLPARPRMQATPQCRTEKREASWMCRLPDSSSIAAGVSSQDMKGAPTISRPRTKQRNSRPGRMSRHARSASTRGTSGRDSAAAPPGASCCPAASRCCCASCCCGACCTWLREVTGRPGAADADAAGAEAPAAAAISAAAGAAAAAAAGAAVAAGGAAQASNAWQMSCAMRSELCSSSSTWGAVRRKT